MADRIFRSREQAQTSSWVLGEIPDSYVGFGGGSIVFMWVLEMDYGFSCVF